MLLSAKRRHGAGSGSAAEQREPGFVLLAVAIGFVGIAVGVGRRFT